VGTFSHVEVRKHFQLCKPLVGITELLHETLNVSTLPVNTTSVFKNLDNIFSRLNSEQSIYEDSDGF
jgi:hypothetical protein